MIYLLTAIGLPPGGSSTVHIYTQTVHRTTQNKEYIEQHKKYLEKETNFLPYWNSNSSHLTHRFAALKVTPEHCAGIIYVICTEDRTVEVCQPEQEA
jgi:hypothetical protein